MNRKKQLRSLICISLALILACTPFFNADAIEGSQQSDPADIVQEQPAEADQQVTDEKEDAAVEPEEDSIKEESADGESKKEESADGDSKKAESTKEDLDAEEPSEDPSGESRTEYRCSTDGVEITAVLSDADIIPDDAKLTAARITDRTSGYNYDAYMEALNAGQETVYSENNTLLYDIAFIKDGKEIQPDGGTVTVTFDFKDDQLAEDLGVKKASDLNVIHLPLKDKVRDQYDTTKAAKSIEAKDIEKETIKDNDLNIDVKKETVEFKLDSFSGVAFIVPEEEESQEEKYTVHIKYHDYSGNEISADNIGNYYVLIKQGNDYFYKELAGDTISTAEFTLAANEWGPKEKYKENIEHTVSIINSTNNNGVINSWEAHNQIVNNNNLNTFEEGDTVGVYTVTEIKTADTNKSATIILTKKPSIETSINAYDKDGTMPYSMTSEDLAGNRLYAVAVLVEKGADRDSTPVAWSIVPVDMEGKSTVDLAFRDFYAYGEDGSSKDTVISYDPTQHDLGARRGISLYRTTSGDAVDTYKKLQDMIETGTVTDQIMDNFEYTGNTTLNVNSNPGEKTHISFRRSNNKVLQIKLDFNDKGTTIKNTDNLYLLLEVEHQTSWDSFYLKKLVSGSEGITVDENGDMIIPIPNWMTNDGNPKNDKFTGKEAAIRVWLLNGTASTNMNNAIARTNCSVAEEGAITLGYTVHYDFSETPSDAIIEKDNVNRVDTYTKVIEMDRVNISSDYDFRSILGPGIGYGITADRLEQGGSDFQSNFAVNNYKDGGKGVNPDLSGGSSGALAIGNYVYYNEDGTIAGIDPDGKVFIGLSHNGELILYTDSPSRVRDPRDWVHTVPTTPDEVADNIVEPTISHMESISAELAEHAPNITSSMTDDKVTIDATNYPDGTTIYVDGDMLDEEYGSFSGGRQLRILKKQNQTIVFNLNESETVTIKEYVVTIYDDEGTVLFNGNSAPSTENAQGNINHQNSLVDELCKTIVFNMPVASEISMSSTAGMFLIPNENSKTLVESTSTGWLISDGYVYNKGEWHFAWADLNDVDTIELNALKKIKRGSEQTKRELIPSGNQKFEFEFSQFVDGHWVSRETIENQGAAVTYRSQTPEKDENGNVVSSELSDGWNVYRIRETKKSDATPGQYDNAENVYYALVKYDTVNTTDRVIKIASINGYYTEFNEDRFSADAENASVFVSGLTASPSFINVQKTGNLELSKVLHNAETDDQTKFTFVITLSCDDIPVSGIYQYTINDNTEKKNIEFKNGIASVSLAAGETAHIEGIPAGATYTIEEKTVPGYYEESSTEAEGTIQEGETISSKFVNTAVGNLAVTKTVLSNVAEDSQKNFKFKVTLDDDSINGKFGEMTFYDGVAEFTLKDGDSCTAENLPLGIGYEVEEIDLEPDFEVIMSGESGIISSDSPTASFVNSRVKEGTLSVTKEVVSDDSNDKSKEFQFTVNLAKINGSFGDAEFSNGKATVGPLEAGKSVVVAGLPDHIKYTITSEPSLNGTYGNLTFADGVCEYTSEDGTLRFAEDSALKNHIFNIKVSITGTYGDMTFLDGVAKFTLKDGESYTARNLPLDIDYTVTEKEDNKDGFTTTWIGKTGKTAAHISVKAVNKKESNKGRIILKKTGENGADLAGAKFDLYRVKSGDETADSKINSEALITDSEGKIEVDNLEPGDYYFLETEAPEGYATPEGDNAKTQTKTVIAGQSAEQATVSMTNNKEAKGIITLTKSGKNSAPLAGAEFNLFRVKTGDETADVKINTDALVTDAQGKIEVGGLDPGQYYFVETKAPDGYVTPTGEAAKTETKTIAAGQSIAPQVEVSMTNTEEAKGKITLTKTGKDNAKLAGAKFDLYKVKTGDETADVKINTDALVTDAQGKIEVGGLDPGQYYFVETEAPEGYVMPTEDAAKTETKTIAAGQSTPPQVEVSMTNTEEAKGKITLTKTGKDNAKLAGAKFDMYRMKTGDESADVKINADPLETNADGQITVESLDPGTYYFVETEAPEGYVTPTGDAAKTETAEVKAGQKDPQELTVTKENTEEGLGTITLTKTDTSKQKKLSGAKFDLYRVKKADETSDVKINTADLTTDANGLITVDNLKPGTYYFVETKAPEGYVTPTGDATRTATRVVEAGQTSPQALTVDMINTEEAKGKITLTKTGKDNAKLAGAKFDLYRVKTGDETADVKINSASLVTREDGTITQENLEPGTYYFVETEAPSGYVTPIGDAARTDTRVVEAGQTSLQPLTVDMTNTEEAKGKITLTKTGKDNAKLAGAKFDLYRVKTGGETADVKINSAALVTKEDGTITQENLEPGTYYFVETEAPEGYVTPTGDAAKTETRVVEAGKSKLDPLFVEMTNAEEQKGKITLIKKDTAGAYLEGAVFDLYKSKFLFDEKVQENLVTKADGKIVVEGLDPGKYYFVETQAPEGYITPTGDAAKTEEKEILAGQTEIPEVTVNMTNQAEAKGKITLTKTGKGNAKLAGAKFDLYRVKTGEETADFKINSESLVTKEDGTITQENLEPGTYYFVETKAPEGYVTPTGDAAKTETKTIAAGQSTAPQVEVSMANTEEAKGVITLKKTGVDSKPLAGAEFNLYRVKSGDEPEYVKVNENTLSTNSDGEVTVDNLEPGTYFFKETKAPKGYVTPTGDAANTETAIVEAGKETLEPLEISFSNTAEGKGKIILTKKDSVTGEELGGAEFDIYKVNEGDEGEDVKINTEPLVTTEDGIVEQDNLEPGEYYFRETKAPKEYAIPENPNTDKVKVLAGQKDAQIFEIEMENDRAYGRLLLTKEIDEYIDGESTNATFVFKITGGSREDGNYFEETKSVHFNADSNQSDTVSMVVPLGIDLKVVETYSGSYNPETKTQTLEPRDLIIEPTQMTDIDPETGEVIKIPYYKVSFKNNLVRSTKGKGIINQYGASDGRTVIEERIGKDD